MKPGRIITEEPSYEPGMVVVDNLMEAFVQTENLTWCSCTRGTGCTKCRRRWDELIHPVRYAWGPSDEPETAPAAEWESVTADQVRIGDEIETQRGDAARIGGLVTSVDDEWVTLGGEIAVNLAGRGIKAIRRRVRQPMPEPDAPAVVRHAGRVYARSVRQTAEDGWYCLSHSGFPWLTWQRLLALDPATDPVVIYLGDGA